MIRTAAGWWMLGLVLAGLVAGSAVFGAQVVGSPLRQPPPTPPPIGACVDRDGITWTVVSCDTPHQGEIIATVEADTPLAGTPVESCAATVAGWVGVDLTAPDRNTVPEDSGWVPAPVWAEPATFRSPGGPGWSWSACVATPMLLYPSDGRYPGSLLGMNQVPAADRPTVLRRCHQVPQSPESRIGCDRPHRGEVVAIKFVVQEYDPTADAVPPAFDIADELDGCRDLVAEYLGAPVDAHPGDLRVEIAQIRQGSGGVVIDGITHSYLRLRLSCLVEVVGDDLLTGSVAGIGTGPVPR